MRIDDIPDTLRWIDLYAEAIAVQELIAENKRLKSLKDPVCPHCLTTLEPKIFMGYYDSFYFWGCECPALKDAGTVRGTISC